MKKIIICGLTLCLFVFQITLAHAETLSNLQVQLATLQQKVLELSAQLGDIFQAKNQAAVGSVVVPKVTSVTFGGDITGTTAQKVTTPAQLQISWEGENLETNGVTIELYKVVEYDTNCHIVNGTNVCEHKKRNDFVKNLAKDYKGIQTYVCCTSQIPGRILNTLYADLTGAYTSTELGQNGIPGINPVSSGNYMVRVVPAGDKKLDNSAQKIFTVDKKYDNTPEVVFENKVAGVGVQKEFFSDGEQISIRLPSANDDITTATKVEIVSVASDTVLFNSNSFVKGAKQYIWRIDSNLISRGAYYIRVTKTVNNKPVVLKSNVFRYSSPQNVDGARPIPAPTSTQNPNPSTPPVTPPSTPNEAPKSPKITLTNQPPQGLFSQIDASRQVNTDIDWSLIITDTDSAKTYLIKVDWADGSGQGLRFPQGVNPGSTSYMQNFTHQFKKADKYIVSFSLFEAELVGSFITAKGSALASINSTVYVDGTLTVTSPKASASVPAITPRYKQGSILPIKWEQKGRSGEDVSIKLYNSQGVMVTEIGKKTNIGNEQSNAINYSIPQTLPIGQYTVEFSWPTLAGSVPYRVVSDPFWIDSNLPTITFTNQPSHTAVNKVNTALTWSLTAGNLDSTKSYKLKVLWGDPSVNDVTYPIPAGSTSYSQSIIQPFTKPNKYLIGFNLVDANAPTSVPPVASVVDIIYVNGALTITSPKPVDATHIPRYKQGDSLRIVWEQKGRSGKPVTIALKRLTDEYGNPTSDVTALGDKVNSANEQTSVAYYAIPQTFATGQYILDFSWAGVEGGSSIKLISDPFYIDSK